MFAHTRSGRRVALAALNTPRLAVGSALKVAEDVISGLVCRLEVELDVGSGDGLIDEPGVVSSRCLGGTGGKDPGRALQHHFQSKDARSGAPETRWLQQAPRDDQWEAWVCCRRLPPARRRSALMKGGHVRATIHPLPHPLRIYSQAGAALGWQLGSVVHTHHRWPPTLPTLAASTFCTQRVQNQRVAEPLQGCWTGIVTGHSGNRPHFRPNFRV